MKILFVGDVTANSGPSNVNKGMVQNLTNYFWRVRSKNKYTKLVESFWKCFFSDVIVVSGLSRQGMILAGFAKFLGRKVAYIMHGCAEYEVVINRQKGRQKDLQQEQYLLEKADLLLPVSKRFRSWVCDRYPQYAEKTSYLYNGIDASLQQCVEERSKVPGTVAAMGADRLVKNNIVVARAVEKLAGKASLAVYGTIEHGVPEELKHTVYTGKIPHGDYIEKLEETELYVQNSIFEPFSISAVEALLCGCSLLISENVGVADLLTLEESDVIHDPMDEQEIQTKIEYLLEHPNNKRLLSGLDLDACSYEKSVARLEQMCRELVCK